MPVRERLTIKQEVSLRWTLGETASTARARVANILAHEVWLDLMSADSGCLELPEGHPLELSMRDQHEKLRHTFWGAETQFIEVIRSRPPRITVERPVVYKPIQRRAYFRIRVGIQFVVAVPDPEAAENGTTAKAVDAFAGMTQDLSGGGLMFITEHELKMGQRVELVLECPPGHRVVAAAEVVRIEDPPVDLTIGKPTRLWSVALAFRRIPERDRDRIVGYLFERERMLKAVD